MKTLELLSINGLCHIVGVPQDTAEHWIEDFTIYIPRTEHRDGLYYHLEAIDVLKFIKECKNQNYQKPQIMEMLANKCFPTIVERTIEDIQLTFNQGNYKENILTVMQTIGKTVSNVANQEKSIKAIQEQQTKQKKRMKDTEKLVEEINDLKREIETLKQKSSQEKEYELKKESFAQLFEKQKEDYDVLPR